MPFYLRRGKNFGPLRFNFSKGGVGVSVGVKGARVGVGPGRGPYVHVGREGVYYRKTLGKPVRGMRRSSQRPDGATASSATETYDPYESHEGIADEIGRARGLPQWWFVILVVAAVLLVASKWFFGLAVVALAVVVAGAMRRRSEVNVTYTLDEDGQERHEALAHIVNNLAAPVRVWLVVEYQAQDWKRGGGATTGIRRVPLEVSVVKLRGYRSNIQVPGLQGRGFKIAFMPDALYVQTTGGTRSADYERLAIEGGAVRYVEDEPVPPGATQVGETWQYVNRDGSRDRRFSNNRRLPVLEYGTVHVNAEPDLEMQFQVSTQEAAQEFRNDLAHFCETVRTETPGGTVTSTASIPQTGAFHESAGSQAQSEEEPVPPSSAVPDVVPQAVQSVLSEVASDVIGDQDSNESAGLRYQEILEQFDLLPAGTRLACIADTYRVCREWARQLLDPCNTCAGALSQTYGPEVADTGLNQLLQVLNEHEPTPDQAEDLLRTALMAIYLEKTVLELAGPVVGSNLDHVKELTAAYHKLKAKQVEVARGAGSEFGFLKDSYLATYFASPVTGVIDDALMNLVDSGKREFLLREIRRSASWASSILKTYRRYIKNGADRLIQSDLEAAKAALNEWDEDELVFNYQQIRDTPYVMMSAIVSHNPEWSVGPQS